VSTLPGRLSIFEFVGKRSSVLLSIKKATGSLTHGFQIKRAMGSLHPWLFAFSGQSYAWVQVSKEKKVEKRYE
jgi:hypothetical protein